MTTHTKIFRFSPRYFTLMLILFVIEIMIANYASGWIRSYFGDILVVILIYTGIKSLFNIKSHITIIGTLIFACSVEISQYFKLAELLGFAKGSIAHIILGNTFSLEDLACYALGCLLIFVLEKNGIPLFPKKKKEDSVENKT